MRSTAASGNIARFKNDIDIAASAGKKAIHFRLSDEISRYAVLELRTRVHPDDMQAGRGQKTFPRSSKNGLPV